MGFDDPWFNLTAEVEVGPTRRWCAAQDASFTFAAWYAVLVAANGVEAFRLRLRDGGVWRHDTVRIGVTVMRPDRTFTYAHLDHAETLAAFASGAAAETRRRIETPGLQPEEGGDDLLHGTVIPWVRFTGIKHARKDTTGSIPKISLGRATPVGDAVKLPVNVELHHALGDGVDVGAFLERLQGVFADPDRWLGGASGEAPTSGPPG